MNSDRAARLNGAVNRAFGETFTFTARKVGADEDVNKRKVADTGRAEFQVSGVWTGGAKERHPKARGYASDHAQGATVSGPIVSFADDDLQWAPQEGDLCKREQTSEVFAVTRNVPNGFGTTHIYLTAKQR